MRCAVLLPQHTLCLGPDVLILNLPHLGLGSLSWSPSWRAPRKISIWSATAEKLRGPSQLQGALASLRAPPEEVSGHRHPSSSSQADGSGVGCEGQHPYPSPHPYCGGERTCSWGTEPATCIRAPWTGCSRPEAPTGLLGPSSNGGILSPLQNLSLPPWDWRDNVSSYNVGGIELGLHGKP